MKTAILVAAIHAAFLVVVQLENFFCAVHADTRGTFLFLARLPFFQLENLAVAAGLGAVCFFVAGRRQLELVFLVALTLLNCCVVLDQIAYRLFLAHFTPSMNQGSTRWTVFLDSLLAEVDGVSLFNLALVLFMSVGVAWLLFGARTSPAPARVDWKRQLWSFWLVHYVLVSILLVSGTETFALDHHPVLAWFGAGHRPGATAGATGLARAPLERALFMPRYGHFEEAGDVTRALASFATARARRKRAPNIIFIVLESVGAKQLLLSRGGFSPEVTPFLHEYESHAVIFDSLYGIYPATTRAHQPLNTGGYAMTWGGFDDAIDCKYVAPTLTSQMHRAGYTTALFSAPVLEAERLSVLYKSVGGFDKYFDFGEAPMYYQQDHRVHSWGGSEDKVGLEILNWLDGPDKPGRERPFFLQFLTISTHHPYGTPRDYAHPFKDDTAANRYRNSLHYTDYVLGKLLGNLAYRGLLDDTLVVLTGDHGEAFGDLHAGNVLHGNRLYDENMRGFLIVLDATFNAGPLRSGRVASSGDVLPTLARLARVGGNTQLGQNLFSPSYEPRTVFFYKSTPPEQWGLRDGQWKFIAGMTDKEKPELYDLSADPDEKVNLAGLAGLKGPAGSRLKPQLESYTQALTEWFAGMTPAYVRRLDGCDMLLESDATAANVWRHGPKSLAVGRFLHQAGEETFEVLARANPYEQLIAWITWQSYTERHRLSVDWTDPRGAVHSYPYIYEMKNSRTHLFLEEPLPLEAGVWKVAIVDQDDGNQVLMRKSVTIDAEVPLSSIGLGAPQARLTAPGSAAAGQPVVLGVRWQARWRAYRVWCNWLGDGGRKHKVAALIRTTEHTISCAPPQGLAPGHWVVEITSNEGLHLGQAELDAR
ncbi:MAG: sulfatase-like hydrolase/transferase [Deltaproteobacteria bacterium]|nr:sulfatase-like hydrolase/transferase [Deltaproteobacteria bacterium]